MGGECGSVGGGGVWEGESVGGGGVWEGGECGGTSKPGRLQRCSQGETLEETVVCCMAKSRLFHHLVWAGRRMRG